MKSTWLVLLCALTGCQVVSGISPLHVEEELGIEEAGKSGMAGKPAAESGGKGGEGGEGGVGGMAGSGGEAGHAGAAGGPEMAGSGGVGPVCEREKDAECNFLEDCGCNDAAQHCQARGAEAKGTCVKKGKRKLGETCKSPDECEKGTCDEQICRAYCEGDRCDGGLCLAAKGEGDKPLANVKVCWNTCQPQNKDSCASGTACRTREIDGATPSFCMALAAPCPTTEDGTCDEGITCAGGTDSVDCNCKKPEGTECNLVDQCGCGKGKSCGVDNVSEKAMCGTTGIGKNNEPCANSTSCEAGLSCVFNPYGSCRHYCNVSTDCEGMLDACTPVSNREGKEVFKVCATGCSDTMPCPAGNSCIKQSTGSFCRPFVPELSGGQCNLSGQLGCDTMAGTACALVEGADKKLTTQCIMRTGTIPKGAACKLNSECENGTICELGVCRHYCDVNKKLGDGSKFGCGDGEQCVDTSTADQPRPGICLAECTANSDCSAGLSCWKSKFGKICIQPLTTDCPKEDKQCDEPQGTGLCAAGYDTVDCMGTP